MVRAGYLVSPTRVLASIFDFGPTRAIAGIFDFGLASLDIWFFDFGLDAGIFNLGLAVWIFDFSLDAAAGRSLPSLASGSQRPICIVIVAMFVVGVVVIVAVMCHCPMFVVITCSA